MNSFPRQEVMECCALYGPQVKVPAGLDPVRVMVAIAAVESGGGDVSFVGNNCGPRHEPAYEAGGAVWAQASMRPLLVLYPPVGMPPQSPAAMSYGPWQMMFLNFARGLTPQQLEQDLDLCAQNFVRFFNSIAAGNHVRNLAEIGEVWNEGHIAPDPAYVAKLQSAYSAAAALS